MRRLRFHPRCASRRRQSRGLSLVELLVGVAIGLVVVAAASYVAVNQLGDNRRMLLETQVQQDLRATADLISRDLRRSGYWGSAESGVWYEGGPSVVANPYTSITPDADGAVADEVTFVYSRLNEDGVVDVDEERFGFKLDNESIRMLIGNAWQELTDSNVLRVTRFDVTVRNENVVQACFKECAGGGTACWPSQAVRSFTVEIEASARFDSAVRRSIRNNVRLRNDVGTPSACPA
ncbi:MAG TPA: prepilin-type N-terminal cleavage/methylation domain-containing protein [Rubrivivax sp.]